MNCILFFMSTHRGCTLSLVAEMIKNTYHKHQTTILSHKLLCMQQKFSLHSAQRIWASGGQSMSMIFLRDKENTGFMFLILFWSSLIFSAISASVGHLWSALLISCNKGTFADVPWGTEPHFHAIFWYRVGHSST